MLDIDDTNLGTELVVFLRVAGCLALFYDFLVI